MPQPLLRPAFVDLVIWSSRAVLGFYRAEEWFEVIQLTIEAG